MAQVSAQQSAAQPAGQVTRRDSQCGLGQPGKSQQHGPADRRAFVELLEKGFALRITVAHSQGMGSGRQHHVGLRAPVKTGEML